MQPSVKSGLDQIFARMGPKDSSPHDGDDRIDNEDERDGSLLGDAEDSVYGRKGAWKSSRP